MKPVAAIETVDLFPPLSRELLGVLKALQPTDWDRPTACGDWTVRDVAAHLLGGNLGRLRDPDSPADEPIRDYDELLGLINRGNAEWVLAARRISPRLLIEFLALTDPLVYVRFKALDPDAPAGITVAWASDQIPPNWFDIAREYTERWLHQQHIREAVGLPILNGRDWLHPVLDTFLRGLPRAFRGLEASPGNLVYIQMTGPAGGEWTLVPEDDRWVLFAGSAPRPACRVSLDADLAWRLFTKGVSPHEARSQVRIDGDMRLGEQVLQLVSIMA